MQPRPADHDVDALVRPGLDADVLPVELKEREEIDEVRFHEAPSAQVSELRVGEAQLAQVRYLGTDLIDVAREIDSRRPALELVLDLRAGKVVQHDLHHRELVQVGVEQ